MEETIPTSSKSSSNRGIPPREVIEYVTQGEVQISTLKLAKSDEKVQYLQHSIIICRSTHVHVITCKMLHVHACIEMYL